MDKLKLTAKQKNVLKDYAEFLRDNHADRMWEYHEEMEMLKDLGYKDVEKMYNENNKKGAEVLDEIRDIFCDYLYDALSYGTISRLKKKINKMIKIPLLRWTLVKDNFKEEV